MACTTSTRLFSHCGSWQSLFLTSSETYCGWPDYFFPFFLDPINILDCILAALSPRKVLHYTNVCSIFFFEKRGFVCLEIAIFVQEMQQYLWRRGMVDNCNANSFKVGRNPCSCYHRWSNCFKFNLSAKCHTSTCSFQRITSQSSTYILSFPGCEQDGG